MGVGLGLGVHLQAFVGFWSEVAGARVAEATYLLHKLSENDLGRMPRYMYYCAPQLIIGQYTSLRHATV